MQSDGGAVNLRFVIPALVQLLVLDSVVHAQLPPRLERCFPYPTLAQEISAMQDEISVQEFQSVPAPRVVIASIRFAPATHISEFTRGQIISSIKSPEFHDDPSMHWLKEMQDVGIRWALQDSGYWNAKVTVGARLLDGTKRRHRYLLTLHINEGSQYRLGSVHFKPSDPDKTSIAFSATELRQHVHMGRGEIFSAAKVRSSMEEITQLYATKGYIDIVPEPELEHDRDGGPINLIVKLDEGPQYRIGRVDFLGLDESSQNQLRLQFRPGELFNKALVDDLLRQNKSLLPADASWQDVRIGRNTKEGVVDVRFDFYSCPEASAIRPNS